MNKQTLTPELSWLHFARIDSTNSYLMQHQSTNVLCSADVQTNGRGRRDAAKWQGNDDSLMFSLSFAAPKTAQLSLWPLHVALTLADTLSPLLKHGKVQIKWPNDLYVVNEVTNKNEQPAGKAAGILVESQLGLTNKVVTGIGLNRSAITVDAPYPVAYFAIEMEKQALLFLLANRLFSAWQQFLQHTDLDPLRFQAYDYLKQKRIRATDVFSKQSWEGKACGIDAQGGLKLAVDADANHTKNTEHEIVLRSQQHIEILQSSPESIEHVNTNNSGENES